MNTENIEMKKLINEMFNNSYDFQELKNVIKDKDFIIYGAGNLGSLAVEILGNIDIYPKYIVDKNKNLEGKKINGIDVIHPEKLSLNDKENSVFVISIVKIPFNNIKDDLLKLGCKYIYPFYDITNILTETNINNGWLLEDLSENTKHNIIDVYNGFKDKESKLHYLQWLYWRICRKEVKCNDINTENKFFIDEIKSILSNDEVYIDIGSYEGQTIVEFINSVDGKFKGIIGFEPDAKSYESLYNSIKNIENEYTGNIETFRYAIGECNKEGYISETLGMANNIKNSKNEFYSSKISIMSLDEFEFRQDPTFIKIHAEGMEYEAIKGGINTILKYRPVIVITTYHNEDGICKIPKFLMDNTSNYEFYYRLHGYCGTQSVLYVIPKERQYKGDKK
ncbi:FkbM family methyltransferase [Romboutsia maritimum]|uniref:FkbM family methyltransferase n=1 Tax=Romboutsia maritimum TaxID=2020948 RepID=A0A371IVL8_9FIRM|nr:FkbM family methyltransferase [Romboutsia maritimum]RDY24511.1 FkbM family methyltransferase [Romboutsia maritimum]